MLNQSSVSAGVSGALAADQNGFEQFAKATVETNAGTDTALLEGMTGALRREDLDPVRRAVVAQYDHFQFMKNVAEVNSETVLKEWMVQLSRGGQVGGRFNSESGSVTADTGDYRRWNVTNKFLMTRAEITHAASITSLHGTTARAESNENALVRISETFNWGMFHGNPAVSPEQFAGLDAQLAAWDAEHGTDQVVNLDGSSDVNDLVKRVFTLKALTRQRGRFGDLTEIWTDEFAQSDIDANLFSQYRIELNTNGAINYGGPVGAIKTSSGNVKLCHDLYINNFDNTRHPMIVDNSLPDNAPPAPTATFTPVINAPGSFFSAGREGTYYLCVAAVNGNGVIGNVSAIESVAVAQRGAVNVGAVAAAAGINATTGFALYASRRNPGSAPTLADMRLVAQFARTGPTSTYAFNMSDIPGTSNFYALNNRKEALARTVFQKATTFGGTYPYDRAVYTWLVIMYGALMLGIPTHHYRMKNFIPSAALWRVF